MAKAPTRCYGLLWVLLQASGPHAADSSAQEPAALPLPLPLQFRRSAQAVERRAQNASEPRIPRQIVLTSKQASMGGLPPAVQANLKHTLELDPDLSLRWFDDPACSEYLQTYFGKRFAERLQNEPRGSFRGDLCRAAVLFREGGFYVDLDVQMRVPLSSLVSNDTTFMTAFTADGAILNALVAAEPHNAVMAETLRELRRWYDGDASRTADQESEKTTNEWMGPMTMLRGLRTVLKQNCPSTVLEEMRSLPEWSCGTQQLKFYDERELDCTLPEDPGGECPPGRAGSDFQGAFFGIFVPSSSGVGLNSRVLVAWPRFEACQDWGCKGGGWDESTAASSADKSAARTEDALNFLEEEYSQEDTTPKDGAAPPRPGNSGPEAFKRTKDL